MLYVVVIAGPTGTGKTEFAARLCREFDGEIISADSMQIYKRMDIGTAKADLTETGGIVQHMIDVVEPWENFSAALYREYADRCIADVAARGKLPVLTGGTGLFINSVLFNMSFSHTTSDAAVRERLTRECAENGVHSLYERLLSLDPESAGKLAPTDERRIVRALEIYELTGKTKSENRDEHMNERRYDVSAFYLTRERSELYERADERVDRMMERGLVAEVRSLMKEGVTRSMQSMQAIGYKEIAAYIDGECTLEEATEAVKRNTRRYVKRQGTWFGRYDFFTKVDMNDGDAMERVFAQIRSKI